MPGVLCPPGVFNREIRKKRKGRDSPTALIDLIDAQLSECVWSHGQRAHRETPTEGGSR